MKQKRRTNSSFIERPPFATVWEYRGKVFSAGSDPDEYTVPNFLSRYTDTQGSPVGVTLPMSRGKELDEAVKKKRSRFRCCHVE